MAIEPSINPQFRTEATGEDSTSATVAADHSAEAMWRLRHPFEPAPTGAERAVTGTRGYAG